MSNDIDDIEYLEILEDMWESERETYSEIISSTR